MSRDVFAMVASVGPTAVSTSLNIVVGRMSKGLENVFMALTTFSRSLRNQMCLEVMYQEVHVINIRHQNTVIETSLEAFHS